MQLTTRFCRKTVRLRFDSRLDILTKRFVTLLARASFRELIVSAEKKRQVIDDLYAKSPRVSI